MWKHCSGAWKHHHHGYNNPSIDHRHTQTQSNTLDEYQIKCNTSMCHIAQDEILFPHTFYQVAINVNSPSSGSELFQLFNVRKWMRGSDASWDNKTTGLITTDWLCCLSGDRLRRPAALRCAEEPLRCATVVRRGTSLPVLSKTHQLFPGNPSARWRLSTAPTGDLLQLQWIQV